MQFQSRFQSPPPPLPLASRTVSRAHEANTQRAQPFNHLSEIHGSQRLGRQNISSAYIQDDESHGSRQSGYWSGPRFAEQYGGRARESSLAEKGDGNNARRVSASTNSFNRHAAQQQQQRYTSSSQDAIPWPITHDSPFLRRQSAGEDAFAQLSLADNARSQALPLPAAVSHHARSNSATSSASETSSISMFELPTDHYHVSALEPNPTPAAYCSNQPYLPLPAQRGNSSQPPRQMPHFQTTLVSPLGVSSTPVQRPAHTLPTPHWIDTTGADHQSWSSHERSGLPINQQRLGAIGVFDWELETGTAHELGKAMGGPSMNNRKLGLYKTELCRSWESTGSCRYGHKCQFAHSRDELRVVDRHPKHKSEVCRTFWISGQCPYGRRCCFIHTNVPGSLHHLSTAPAYDTTLEQEQPNGSFSRLQQRRSDASLAPANDLHQGPPGNHYLKLDLQQTVRPQYRHQNSNSPPPSTDSHASTRTRSPSSASAWSYNQSPASSASSACSRENDANCATDFPFGRRPSQQASWQPFSAEMLDTSSNTVIGSQARFLTELLDE